MYVRVCVCVLNIMLFFSNQTGQTREDFAYSSNALRRFRGIVTAVFGRKRPSKPKYSTTYYYYFHAPQLRQTDLKKSFCVGENNHTMRHPSHNNIIPARV